MEKHRKTKIPFFLLLFFVLFLSFQASSVSALSLTYPKLPGSLTPNEIASKPAGLQLPLLINYYIRFFYLIVLIVVIGSLIYAGILYSISGAKPVVLAGAKKKVSQSLLGLLIIVISYALLGLINPQLFILKSPSPPQPTAIYTPPPPEAKQVKYAQISLGTILDKDISSIEEETTYKGKTVKKVEVPFLTTIDDLKDAIAITEKIKENLAGCHCGASRYHIVRNGFLYKCVGGAESTTAIGSDYNKAKGSQKKCIENCYDCGVNNYSGIPDKCDLEKVAKLRKELTTVLAKLNADQIKLSPQQLEEIAETLKTNAARFLLQKLDNIQFEKDFEVDTSDKEAGLGRKIEKPKQLPKPAIVHMSPGIIDPLTFYAPIDGPLPADVLANNKKTYKTAKQMMSLYSVLTQMSLDDIQAMIQSCLQSAFGNGSFALDSGKMKDLVDKAIKDGMADFVGGVLSKNADNITNEFIKRIKEGINKSAKVKLEQRENVVICPSPNPNVKCNTIPPHYLSNKLASIFTNPLSDALPDSIKNLLTNQIRTSLFGTTTDKILKRGERGIIDNALNGALSKNLTDQIPWLREELQKKMLEALPDLVATPLGHIDVFLYAHLHNLKKRINDKIEDVAKEIGDKLNQPIAKLMEGFKKRRPELFRENLEADNCWAREWPNRYYDYSQKKCLETTPEDFNPGGGFDKIMKNISQWQSNGGDIDSLGYQTGRGNSGLAGFCRRAGFEWDKVNDKCQERQWIDINGLKPSKENFKRLISDFAVGLVNFGERFMVALTQTAVYTMTKYTQVWVDDTILTPLRPYLETLNDFQKQLHKFLNSTIAEVLPQKISGYLQGSVFNIIDDLCQKGGTTIDIYGQRTTINANRSQACQLNETMKKDIVDFASPKVKRFLNEKGVDAIRDYNADLANALNGSLAALLFPGIKNIEKIIKGTPKEIICGEIAISGQRPIDKCENNLDKNSPIPIIANSSTLSKKEKNTCYALIYSCANPAKNYKNKKSGAILSALIEKSCQNLKSQKCNGSCQTCPDQKTKNSCFTCQKMTEKTIFYSLVKSQLQSAYGSPSTNEKDEIKTYQWLTAVFPERVSDIDQIAKERGLYGSWTKATGNPPTSPREEALGTNGNGNTSMYTDPNYTGLKIVSWYVNSGKVSDLLTSFPLGIMDYFTKENYKGKNVLANTMRDSVGFSRGICKRIKIDWQKEKTANSPGAEELLPYFKSCLVINKGPLYSFDVFSKPLINYVRPEPYKIMFTLIETKLKPEERPDALNKLLDILFNHNVADLIKNYNSSNPSIKSAIKFLTTPLGENINNQKRLGEMIFGDLWNKKLTVNNLKKLTDKLGKKPVKLMEPLGKEIKIINNYKSPMELLALKYPLLKERYVDLLGEKLGLTKKAYSLFGHINKIKDKVGEAAEATIHPINKMFENAIVNYPKKITQSVIHSLATKIGLGVGGAAADQIAGLCRPASNKSDCKSNEAYNQTTKECCNLGAGLSCSPMCREKMAGVECQIDQGEEETTDANGKEICCYNNCQRCRRATSKERSNNACYSAGGKQESLVTKRIGGDNHYLCCWNDLLKDVGGKKLCCTNVVSCISRKFTYHLQMLGDVLIDGPLLDELVPAENQ